MFFVKKQIKISLKKWDYFFNTWKSHQIVILIYYQQFEATWRGVYESGAQQGEHRAGDRQIRHFNEAGSEQAEEEDTEGNWGEQD